MAINVIVVAVTLMIGGFVVVWFACPRSRAWIEAPKWQPLAWDSPRGIPVTAPESKIGSCHEQDNY